MDPAHRELYAKRSAAFAGLRLFEPSAGGSEQAPPREQALEAFATGDFDRLAKVASRLASGEAPTSPSSLGVTMPLPELTCSFTPDTVARAARLGLAPVHVEPLRGLVRFSYQHAFRPTFAEDDGSANGTVRVAVRFAPHTPEALRERMQLYLDRPFVNSGGARHLPYLVPEDLLVETFDEPVPGAPAAHPVLLERLGLGSRDRLSRNHIERVLFRHNREVVRELGLDPRVFRLVCLPSDVHVRIGQAHGWGTHPVWTHFDGWMVLPKRRFLALAGGDVRFGGIYDLVGVGDDYDSEHIFARFAVVLRRRMSAW